MDTKYSVKEFFKTFYGVNRHEPCRVARLSVHLKIALVPKQSVTPSATDAVSAHDVSKYILEQLGEMPAMKLHKLLYYCQAWCLVWADKPLFSERIEAWANGPVIREVYAEHRGKFAISTWPKGNIQNLSARQKKVVKSVLSFYGNKTAQWLSDLTHREQPWVEARTGLAPLERGNREITWASMAEYYSSI